MHHRWFGIGESEFGSHLRLNHVWLNITNTISNDMIQRIQCESNLTRIKFIPRIFNPEILITIELLI